MGGGGGGVIDGENTTNLWNGDMSCRIPLTSLTGVLPNLLEDPDLQDERDPGRTIFMLDQEVPGLSIKQQQIFTLLFHFNS
jgi:hypothetical protein